VVAAVLHKPGAEGDVRVVKDCVVCIDYTIRLPSGEVIETSVGTEPLTYLQGRRQIVPGVERAVEGLAEGESVDVVVAPKEAYGERNPSGVFLVARAGFPPDEPPGPGMTFSAKRPDGTSFTFRVIDANQELVLVDTNHPLAGETLHVAVKVHHVRNATAEELLTGKARNEVTAPQYLA
jgi:FKBP-type peptidyl-prolyl cis-trans isomerase SlyD